MPKFPRIPRVSIVVPLQRDERLFEETLLSVLENQVEGCEILAVHNGTYSDPFDLGDEVKFVLARSSNLVDLIRDAYDATRGSVVHVLGSGLRGRAGWIEAALEEFSDNNVATVSPAATGWCDDPGRLCRPIVKSRSRQRLSGQNRGFYVNAFFARRRVLGNLLDAVAPAMNDPIAVSYAFGCLLKRAGWQTVECPECLIDTCQSEALEDASNEQRGQCLSAIYARVFQTAPVLAKTAMLKSALLGSGSFGELIGNLRYRASLPVMRRAIDPETVTGADEMSRLLDLHVNASPAPSRRAA